MTISIQVISISRGIAIGKVHCIKRYQIDTPEYVIQKTQIENEISRLNDAITNARSELQEIRDHITKTTYLNISEFINTHLLMLEDKALTEEPKIIIKDRLCNAEWALKLQRDALVNVFDEMADAYLRTRKDDVDHVVNRILRILLKQKPLLDEIPDEHLKNKVIDPKIKKIIDSRYIQDNSLVPFEITNGTLKIAIADASKLSLMKNLKTS